MSRYEEEYRKWVESLPPKQRAKLAAKGIDKPLADDHRVFKTDPSVAFDKASYDFSYDFLDSQEKPTEALEGVEIVYGFRCCVGCLNDCKGQKTREYVASR